MDTYAFDHGLPCLNPNCKSHGRPHPNCKCYSGGEGGENIFNGGPQIPFGHFAHGGNVQANAQTTLGHAAVHHGLQGLMDNAGHASLSEPEKHKKTLSKALDHIGEGDHESAAHVLHGSPIGGGIGHQDLTEMMNHLQGPMAKADFDPEALKSSANYLHSAVKGHKALVNHANSMLGKGLDLKPDVKAREGLKAKLEQVNENPESLLETGGSLSHYSPGDHAELAATVAQATTYLNGIKPKPQQLGPLDKVIPPDPVKEAQYDRQIDIAQNPMLALKHVSSGTLLPQDVMTIQTIYPGLYKSIVDKAGEALVSAKANKMNIPFKQRQALSLLLGQPLDFSMTPQAMQAIMKSQGPQQAQNMASKNEKRTPQKASAVELKQIDKVDEMSQTPIEKRQIGSK